MTIKGIFNSYLYDNKSRAWVLEELKKLIDSCKTDGKHIREMWESWKKTHADEIQNKINKKELPGSFLLEMSLNMQDKIYKLKNPKDLEIYFINPSDIYRCVPMAYNEALQYLQAKQIKLRLGNNTIICTECSKIQDSQQDNGFSQRITSISEKFFKVKSPKLAPYVHVYWANPLGQAELTVKFCQTPG